MEFITNMVIQAAGLRALSEFDYPARNINRRSWPGSATRELRITR
jgi:hypothetical protein